MRQGWDIGFPGDYVLIHEISKQDFTKCSDRSIADGDYRSYILNDKSTKIPNEEMDKNGVRIDLVSKNPASGSAVVRIRSVRPELCVQGFVWREARPEDHVCVIPNRRYEVAEENSLADERREPGGGPFGPNTCKQGFVWREAFEDDFVCVTPTSRMLAATENREAYFKAIGFATYGPLTCKQGFVWREADEKDYVCVVWERRSAVRTENDLGPSRRQPGGGPFGPDTCIEGFVWREAFPEDHVCVTPESRTLARNENEARKDNLSNDPTNNAAASEGKCVDVDCIFLTEEEVPQSPPMASDDVASTTQGMNVLIRVADNDSDVDNNLDPTSIFVKAPPNYGVVSKSSDNMAFIYTPNADFLGDDSFVYMICGTDWLCSQANVSITVIEEDCCALVFFLLRWLCWIFNLLFGVCLFG